MMLSENNKDLTLTTEDGIFNHRIGYLIFQKDTVLLQKGTEDDGFWFIPGGRVQFGETSQQALKREVKEELGITLEKFHLSIIVENHFKHNKSNCHEIGLYYTVTAAKNFDCPKYDEKGNTVIFAWHRINTLQSITLKPTFFQTRMPEFQSGVHHIIHRE